MNVEEVKIIAKACHAMNSRFCEIVGDKVLDWDTMPSDIRVSICLGVENALRGCTPEESHYNWLEFRTNSGWTYGERDDDAKTHPCMLPYDKLPPAQKAKDKIFLAVVEALK